MLKTNNIDVYGFEHAIRGMRNPLASWDKSDSHRNEKQIVQVGSSDLKLMQNLAKAGKSDRKFMRQIVIWMDITAPLYWWKQFDTYKVGTVANSTSTMHCLIRNPFTLDDFSNTGMDDVAKRHLDSWIHDANLRRERMRNVDLDPVEKKVLWDSIVKTMPESYNQTRTICMNYEVAAAMYFDRKDHKLSEWHTLCDIFVKELPYFKDILQLETV